ncbi:MAG: outer membrane beta-barrel protein [Flammeovirgaceae bacterium]|nr:MAG: outer membrane beta-barrel protein [Flammeovirgaceae bacterium]
MRYLTITILTFICIQSFGQFNKGDKALGGTLTSYFQSSPEDQGGIVADNSFGLTPSFGVLVSENLEVGGQIGWSSNYLKSISGSIVNESRSNYFSIGIYTQKYFKLSERFLFSVGGNVGLDLGKMKLKVTDAGDPISESEMKQTAISIGVGPGFLFLPSENWAIRAGFGNIGYRFSKQEEAKRNRFTVSYGTIGLGLVYYFRQGK